jgi:kynurenine formamidase
MGMKNILISFFVISVLSLNACSEQNDANINLNNANFIDLSHSYEEKTLYWPTSPTKFQLTQLSKGISEGGWFYSANTFSMPEHGGTHLDAPIHFDENGYSNEQIPLTQLIGPSIIIDITSKAANNPDYLLEISDIEAFETNNGPIPKGAIVLLKTGWSKFWPDPMSYLGDDTEGDASNLHFPSYGIEAAEFLIIERSAKALGVDTASNDYGQSEDFLVHRLMGAHQIFGMENLTNLDKLPPIGAWVIALPVKIKGGSGGPLRAVAIIPKK